MKKFPKKGEERKLCRALQCCNDINAFPSFHAPALECIPVYHSSGLIWAPMGTAIPIISQPLWERRAEHEAVPP